VVNVEIDWY